MQTFSKESLLDGVVHNNIAHVKSMLTQGVDTNTKNEHNWLALHHACFHGHIEIVELLLTHGADVNAIT